MIQQVLFASALTAVAVASFLDDHGRPHSLQQPAASTKAHPIEWEGSVISALEVKDLAAAKKWYGEVLGCKVFFDLPEQRWCELSTPVENALIGLSQVEPGTAPRGNGGARLSFGVEDVDAARAWLSEKGVASAEIVEIPGVVKLLHLNDPDGNRLLLYEPAGD